MFAFRSLSEMFDICFRDYYVDKRIQRKTRHQCEREVESAAYLAFAFAVEDPPYADSGKLPPLKSVSAT
jgi:hypothetical protein